MVHLVDDQLLDHISSSGRHDDAHQVQRVGQEVQLLLLSDALQQPVAREAARRPGP